MPRDDHPPQRPFSRLAVGSTIILLLLVGAAILYFALRPGQLGDGLYLGWGSVCLLAAMGEVSARTLFHRSLLGFEYAWPVLVLALLGTGIGLLLLGLSSAPRLAGYTLAAGLGTYVVWSLLEIRARRRETLANVAPD